MTDFFVSYKDVLLIILGWLLGLLGSRIIELIRDKHLFEDFKRSFKSEAIDLQVRLVMICLHITNKYGDVTDELYLWALSILKNRNNDERIKTTVDFIEAYLNSTEQQKVLLKERMKNRNNTGLRLKYYSTAFLDANLNLINKSSMNYQELIFDFKNQFSILNQEIADAKEALRMTFDSSISDENHSIISNEIIDRYKFIAIQSKLVVEKLERIINFKSESCFN